MLNMKEAPIKKSKFIHQTKEKMEIVQINPVQQLVNHLKKDNNSKNRMKSKQIPFQLWLTPQLPLNKNNNLQKVIKKPKE